MRIIFCFYAYQTGHTSEIRFATFINCHSAADKYLFIYGLYLF